MKKMMQFKKQKNQKLIFKVILLLFLVIIFILDIIYVAFFRNKTLIEENQNNVVAFQTIEEGVPNFGTEVSISNLETYATPLLNEDAKLLEEILSEYFIKKNISVSSAEIFHVMIPQGTENEIYFFCKTSDANEIVQLIFYRDTKEVAAKGTQYTEDEIKNEVWEDNEPLIQDMPTE